MIFKVSETAVRGPAHFHFLIRFAKHFILIITSFDSIAFNWNLKNLLKLNALFVLFWPFCQTLEKNWSST